MTKRRDQPVDTRAEELLRAKDAELQPFKVGDPIPVRLGVTDMRRLFPLDDGRVMDASTFHRLERNGKFRRFELPTKIGAKHWSGYRVAEYLTNHSFAISIKKSA